MPELIDTKQRIETAVLVGVIRDNETDEQVKEYLDELAFLSETAGIQPLKTFVQRLPYPNPKTFVGTGKLAEITKYISDNEVDIVIFDDELTPSQARNVEKVLERKILDRTTLILNIFAQRAHTSYAKTQVELAQYEYLLPRLTGMWTHLARQRGGVMMRGPGETEIETDRRIIRNRIAKLKEDLQKIDRQQAMQRKNRGKLVRVALVGYTNVGKSTLMNVLSKTEILAENKLFATLDTTVRKVIIGNLPFLLSDTVGFIRKLPHQLVESFKSTLDEVRESDLLLHIVDISHPNFEEQIEVVEKTLHEIGVSDKPGFLIFNKIDAFSFVKKDDDDLTPKLKENTSLDDLKNSWFGKENYQCIFIAAKGKNNITELKERVYQKVKEIHIHRYPYDDFLFLEHAEISGRATVDDGDATTNNLADA